MRWSIWQFAAGFAVAAFVPLVGSVTHARADQFLVCPSGCRYSSIRTAVADARSGDTIVIEPGTYGEHLMLAKDLTLDGQAVTLDGGGASVNRSVVIVERGVTATLVGLTVTDGHSPDFGGGILNYGRLTLQDSQVTNNTAMADGGGIYNNGVLTVQDSLVSNNSSGGPDAGIENDVGTVNLIDTIVANNVSWDCGGTAGAGCQDERAVSELKP